MPSSSKAEVELPIVSDIEKNREEHQLLTRIKNMEKSYEQLKQRFNPQVPSVEIPAGMIEGGERVVRGNGE